MQESVIVLICTDLSLFSLYFTLFAIVVLQKRIGVRGGSREFPHSNKCLSNTWLGAQRECLRVAVSSVEPD